MLVLVAVSVVLGLICVAAQVTYGRYGDRGWKGILLGWLYWSVLCFVIICVMKYHQAIFNAIGSLGAG